MQNYGSLANSPTEKRAAPVSNAMMNAAMPFTGAVLVDTSDTPETRAKRGEPPTPPPVALAMFEGDDYIRELGDRIAALSPSQAALLQHYLERVGVTLPSASS